MPIDYSGKYDDNHEPMTTIGCYEIADSRGRKKRALFTGPSCRKQETLSPYTLYRQTVLELWPDNDSTLSKLIHLQAALRTATWLMKKGLSTTAFKSVKYTP